jgi:hypothetical protein
LLQGESKRFVGLCECQPLDTMFIQYLFS